MNLVQINENINRLLANLWSILSFFKEYLVDPSQNVSMTFKNADGTETTNTFPNISKQIEDNKLYTVRGGLKNLIMNSKFNIAQRNGITPLIFDGYSTGYLADRFYSANRTDGTFTMSKSLMDDKNTLRATVDASPTDLTAKNYWYGFGYAFEGKELFKLSKGGKSVTLSFWFKSNIAGKHPISLRAYKDTGVEFDEDVASFVDTFTYTTANVPQKITWTIPLGQIPDESLHDTEALGYFLTIGFLNQGFYVIAEEELNQWVNANRLVTADCVNWGENVGNFIEVAEIQLEEGSEATPIENRNEGLELLLCQRYFEKGSILIFPYSSDDARGEVNYKATKRKTPSVKIYSPVTGIANKAHIYKYEAGENTSEDVHPDRDRAIYKFYPSFIHKDSLVVSYAWLWEHVNDEHVSISYETDAELMSLV